MNFAIRFEPDGYVTTGRKLMGRQAAGAGFLRAATQGLAGLPLTCYTPHRSSFESFRNLVSQLDPSAVTRWIPATRLARLAEMGTVYLPGPDLGESARHRLRLRPSAYCVVGVTHTTASHSAMDMIADIVAAPVMPWDALICTSSSVAGTVRGLLEEEHDFLERRFGTTFDPPKPQLPVIPLGVHCDHFVFNREEREAARDQLGLSPKEVVVLFVGRLSFHAKAHPHALFTALEAVARSTQQPICLIQCGWFANAAIEAAFVDGMTDFAPTVHSVFTDGRDPVSLRRSWAAADIFVSLSDNVQETFGLTPIEAMAAGLPVVVSDWNGYKDTVRDGVDGFRIPTWMPPTGLGEALAARHELGMESYDRYCALSAQVVSVDARRLRDALTQLVADPELRRSLGESGRHRARQVYDWSVVFGQYQHVMEELHAVRRAGVARRADERLWPVRNSPRRPDPFAMFAGYGTQQLSPTTSVTVATGASVAVFTTLKTHGLWRHTSDGLPSDEVVRSVLAIPEGTVESMALSTRLSVHQVTAAVATLAKMGLVTLAQRGPEPPGI